MAAATAEKSTRLDDQAALEVRLYCGESPDLEGLRRCVSKHGDIRRLYPHKSFTPLHTLLQRTTAKAPLEVVFAIVKFLLDECHLSINSQDNSLRTPLYVFLCSGCDLTQPRSADIVQFLLKNGADPNIMCLDDAPFHLAVKAGAIDLVMIFLQHPTIDVSIVQTAISRQNVLHLIGRNVQLASVLLPILQQRWPSKLIEMMALRDAHDCSPLACAIAANLPDMVALLCQFGALPLPELDRAMYSSAAVVEQLSKVPAVLIALQSDPHYIQKAIQVRNETLVRHLIEITQVSPNLITDPKTGNTCLHQIVCQNSLSMLKILLSAPGGNININAQNINGETPLMLAAECDYLECAHLLLQSGKIDIKLVNCDGKTVLDIAKKDVAALLRDFQLHNRVEGLSVQVDSQLRTVKELELTARPENMLAAKHLAAVFRIIGRLTGTAFVLAVGSQKVLVTSRHIVEGAAAIFIENNLQPRAPLDVCQFKFPTNADIDLAWMLSPDNAPALSLATVFPKIGQMVHVLGYPLDYDEPQAIYSACMIGGARRRGSTAYYLLTGGGINPGNSGGPMFSLTADSTNDDNCILGVVRGAPQRFLGEDELSLKQLLDSENDLFRRAGRLFQATAYVGITEMVPLHVIHEVLLATLPITAAPCTCPSNDAPMPAAAQL